MYFFPSLWCFTVEGKSIPTTQSFHYTPCLSPTAYMHPVCFSTQARLLFFNFFKSPQNKKCICLSVWCSNIEPKCKKGSLQIFHDIWDCVIYPTTFYHFCIFGGWGRVKNMKHLLASFVYMIELCIFSLPLFLLLICNSGLINNFLLTIKSVIFSVSSHLSVSPAVDDTVHPSVQAVWSQMKCVRCDHKGLSILRVGNILLTGDPIKSHTSLLTNNTSGLTVIPFQLIKDH